MNKYNILADIGPNSIFYAGVLAGLVFCLIGFLMIISAVQKKQAQPNDIDANISILSAKFIVSKLSPAIFVMMFGGVIIISAIGFFAKMKPLEISPPQTKEESGPVLAGENK